MNNLFKRLITTTTQQDIKKFDEMVFKIVRNKININDPKLNEKFKESLKQKKECCEKCDEVSKIVKPVLIGTMERIEK